MALDSLFLQQLITELKPVIRNSKIEKISQPHPLDVVLQLRINQNTIRLFISAHPQYARINIMNGNLENPLNPPAFCMLLRKYLENARILEIAQYNFDRICQIYLQTPFPIDGVSQCILIVEMMGKHSNIILINRQNKQILGAAKILSREQNRFREITAGAIYAFPPNQDKELPEPFSDLTILLKSEGSLKDHLQQKYQGISPLIIKELFHRSGLTLDTELPLDNDSLDRLAKNWSSLFSLELTKPYLFLDKKGKMLDYSYWPLLSFTEAEVREFPNGSELLAFYYEKKQRHDYLNQKKKDLLSLVQRELKRCQKKLKLLRSDLSKTEKAEIYRIKGEILFANLHQIAKGASNVELTDFYSGEMIKIDLNPELSASNNAQSYFKKYNKIKNSIIHLEEQIDLAANEEKYLESLLQSLEQAEELDDIASIRIELAEEGYLQKKKQKKTNKKTVFKPYSFRSHDNIEILVGKNNKENDHLTLKMAKNNEMWLHVKDIPGSHVIIRHSGNIPETTLKEAAILAAYYSKSRYSNKVPVDYTLKKYVKKPAGAKPGMVIYTDQKTLFVLPDEELVNSLKK